MPEDVRSRWGDCLPLFERTLMQQGLLSADESSRIREEARVQIEAAVEQARSEPHADPATDDWQVRSERDLVNLRAAR